MMAWSAIQIDGPWLLCKLLTMNNNPDDDIVKDMIENAFANSALEAAKNYMQRGRLHAHLTDADLKSPFMEAFRAWAASPRSDRTALDDLTAEYFLRKLEPPYDELTPEIDAIAEQTKALYKDITDEAKLKIGESMVNEYLNDLDKKQ